MEFEVLFDEIISLLSSMTIGSFIVVCFLLVDNFLDSRRKSGPRRLGVVTSGCFLIRVLIASCF